MMPWWLTQLLMLVEEDLNPKHEMGRCELPMINTIQNCC
jgi:hypothetical protein